MDRRAFLHSVPILVLAGLHTAAAQPMDKLPHVGWLGHLPRRQNVYADSLLLGLRELGWIEGHNFVFDFRATDAQANRLSTLAAELVALNVTLIVAAAGNTSVTAAKDATATIPIVMPWAIDPVGNGIVSSLARPDGNVTGLTFDVSTEQVGKRIELLREVAPRISRVAVLWSPLNVGVERYWKETRAVATRLNLTLQFVEIDRIDALDSALAIIAKERADAIYIVGDALVLRPANLRPVLDFARRNRLPTVTQNKELSKLGALVSYSTNVRDLYKRAAYYVDRILKGAKPGDLPIEQPTKFELVLNLNTAKAIGLTIPQSLLLRADEVIQ